MAFVDDPRRRMFPPGFLPALEPAAATLPQGETILVTDADTFEPFTDDETGVTERPQPDGGVVVQFGAPRSTPEFIPHDANLARHLGDSDLQRIAEDLLEAIESDDRSRQQWLNDRSEGIKLLGLKLESPKTEATAEGMSVVRHPVLLEAVLRGQATARGELLPATGPVKVINAGIYSDPKPPPAPPGAPPVLPGAAAPQPGGSPPIPGVAPPPGGAPIGPAMGGGLPPMPGPMPIPPSPQPPGMGLPAGGGLPPPAGPGMGHNLGPPMGPPPNPYGNTDMEADWLEKDLNFYLTTVATEYVPDTDRMLFWTYFGGSGWKKVYNCPIRRRPVSESVDAADIIVLNTATDLANAPRLTHRIKMRKSVMKRMMLLGVYRRIDLPDPVPESNVVDDKKEEVSGTSSTEKERPQDAPHQVYECYCELDLPQFAPAQFEDSGVPLSYRVAIEKDSREVLEIRRNWEEDDPECLAKRVFVRFPYVDAIGLYGIGLVHILGNAATALTAAWRICLDNGMFNNFPGVMMTREGTRGIGKSEIRIPPGSAATVDTGGKPIGQSVMPLPFKPLDPAFVQFIEALAQTAMRIGGTADIPVGEGKQDAPVGTTLALIEQATKVESAVHKRLHAAQAEEFGLLKERFREDPGAIYRHKRRRDGKVFDIERFVAALEDCDLVPMADPNTPGHLQRLARAQVVKELQRMNPPLYNPREVDERVLKLVNVTEPDSLFAPVGPPPPPSPEEITAQAKAKDADTRQIAELIKAKGKEADIKIQREELAVRLKEAVLRIAQALAVHPEAESLVGEAVREFSQLQVGANLGRGAGGRVP
jgi:hypothetical protein